MMNKTSSLRFCLLALPLLAGLGACTHESAPEDNTAMLPENQRVSNVPWNRPSDWEGRSALGGLANDPKFGGNGGR